MRLIFLSILLNISFQIPEGKINQDSLNNEINKHPVDERIEIYIELSKHFSYTSFEKSFFYAQKAISLAQHFNNIEKEVEALHTIAISHYAKSQYDKALVYFTKGMNTSKASKYIFGVAKSYNGLGVIYKNIGELNTALDYYLKALSLFESLDDKQAISTALSNIGVIYKRWENTDKALDYLNRSLEVAEEIDDKGCISRAITNLGLVYLEMGRYEDAIKGFKWSLNIEILEDDQIGIATAYQNIGDVYAYWENHEMAIEYYVNSLEIEQLVGNSHGIIISLNSIGIAYMESDQVIKAIDYFDQSLKMARESNSINEIKDSYLNLSIAFEKLGKITESFEYYKNYIDYKDSMFVISSQEEFVKLEIKYKTKETAKELELKELELKNSKAEMKKQSVLLYSFIAGFGLVVIFFIFIFRLYRQKKRANKLLKEQKEEISSQRDEISRQKDLVTAHHKAIKDSIDYAQRIQAAIFPTPDVLESEVNEYFLMYKPKDVLSGDFYWFNKVDNHLIIAIADCTGHGVPGALMSILGAAFLNEIVNKEKVINPGDILQRLRLQVISAMKQHGLDEEQKDGMDIALCTINLDTLVCKYSGANNPLYLVTDGNIETDNRISKFHSSEIKANKSFYEIKADKMPIAIYVKMDVFTTHEFQLKKGDDIYLFTDGFADQFGGEKGKKFKYRAFKEMLYGVNSLKMVKQHDKINTIFEEWKENYKQIDDVLLIGIKL